MYTRPHYDETTHDRSLLDADRHRVRWICHDRRPGTAARSLELRPYVVAKNAFGQPDLEAVWTNDNITPLQRPAAWAGKTVLSDAEVEQLKKASQKLEEDGDALFGDELVIDALDGKQQSASHDTETGNYNAFWLPNRDIDNRTSLIIDPPDGRIPPERRRRRRGARRRPNGAGSFRPTAPKAAA